MPPPMKYLYAHKKKSVKKYFLTRSGEKSRSRRIPGGDFFTVVVGRSPSPCATLPPCRETERILSGVVRDEKPGGHF